MKARTILTGILAAAAFGVVGAVATTVASPDPAMAASAGSQLTRSEVLSRARHWYYQDPARYDGGDTSQWMADVDGGHVYRRDCSGFVSMSLHLTSSPSSFQLSTSTYGVQIGWQDLRPGDYLTVDDDGSGGGSDGHVILFERWAPAYPKFTYYGFGGTDGQTNSLRHRMGDFNGAATSPLGGSPPQSDDGSNSAGHTDGHLTSKYKAFRYKNILDNDFADIDGDGRDEMISIRPNGDVYAWRNAGNWNGLTYDGTFKLVAQGFTDASRVRFADIDGDGRDEILNINGNGDVYAYRNIGGWNSTTYTGTECKLVAQGFTDALRTQFADIDGDFRDEILTVNANGDVVAYRNIGGWYSNTYSGNVAKIVAYGFTEPTRTQFADIDGDGTADIIAFYANGDVWAYRNVGGWTGTTYTGSESKLVAQGFTETTLFGYVDGDGKDEIVAFTGNGNVWAYLNVGGWLNTTYIGSSSKVLGANF